MTHKATQRIALLGALTLGFGLVGTSVQAQPPTPGGNNGGNNGGRPNFQTMTPEQRTAMMAQFQERRTRDTLNGYGVTDTKVQDVIVAYVKAQDAARQPLGDQSRLVTDALTNKVPDAQLFTLFATLRTQVEAEKARVEKDRKTLDTLVGYSKNPRLGVVLTMMGLIGDESNYFGGGGRGGRGGFGGGNAGGGQPAPAAPAPAAPAPAPAVD